MEHKKMEQFFKLNFVILNANNGNRLSRNEKVKYTHSVIDNERTLRSKGIII